MTGPFASEELGSKEKIGVGNDGKWMGKGGCLDPTRNTAFEMIHS